MVDQTPELSSRQVREMKGWFYHFDKNGDNRLDKDELKKVFPALGWNLTEEEQQNVIEKADLDQNGYIDYKEYIRLLHSLQKDVETERIELELAFKKLSRDKTGYITDHELKKHFNKNEWVESEKDRTALNDLIKRADKNDDGMINIASFVDLMLERPDVDELTN